MSGTPQCTWGTGSPVTLCYILNDRYYNVEEEEGKYLVQTQSQTKYSGIKVPEVHGTKKGVDPNLRPEWLVRKSQKLAERSRIEQKKGRLFKTEKTKL